MPALQTDCDGFRLLPGYLKRDQQNALVKTVLGALEAAPLFTPAMPRSGKPLSVQMSNFGPLGWIADRTGYRYQPHHPETGTPWPAMPQQLLDLWTAVSGWPEPPQACLINIYGPASRLGVHVDADEDARDAPGRLGEPGRPGALPPWRAAQKTAQPTPSSCPRAMWWFWAARHGASFTVLTASIPVPARCCPVTSAPAGLT